MLPGLPAVQVGGVLQVDILGWWELIPVMEARDKQKEERKALEHTIISKEHAVISNKHAIISK